MADPVEDAHPESVSVSCAEDRALNAQAGAKALARRRGKFAITCEDWPTGQNRDFERSGQWSDRLVARPVLMAPSGV